MTSSTATQMSLLPNTMLAVFICQGFMHLISIFSKIFSVVQGCVDGQTVQVSCVKVLPAVVVGFCQWAEFSSTL